MCAGWGLVQSLEPLLTNASFDGCSYELMVGSRRRKQAYMLWSRVIHIFQGLSTIF